MKPPITYYGGKTRIAERIAGLLPDHEHYVELFAGSLAVLLAKRPSLMETVNDLDGDLMRFWRVLRDRPADFERVAALTPHSRAEHLLACEPLAGEPADPDLEAARRVWIRLTQGRGSHTRRRTGWRYYQNPRGSHASMPDYLSAYVSRICPAAVRLTNVSLECRPALELIGLYGKHPKCLLYADPPYLADGRNSADRQYRFEMLDEPAHIELAEALHDASAVVVLSGYDTPLYRKLYDDWARYEIPATAGHGADRDRTEILWANRPFPPVPDDLFSLLDGDPDDEFQP